MDIVKINRPDSIAGIRAVIVYRPLTGRLDLWKQPAGTSVNVASTERFSICMRIGGGRREFAESRESTGRR